jgi:hypothetical protein
MKRNIYGLIIFLFVIGIFQQMKANQKKEKSYEITKYELVKTENLALLKFSLKPIVEGDIHYFIHAPSQMKKKSIQYINSTFYNINETNELKKENSKYQKGVIL